MDEIDCAGLKNSMGPLITNTVPPEWSAQTIREVEVGIVDSPFLQLTQADAASSSAIVDPPVECVQDLSYC
jgi:hypothetical protein